MTSPISPLHNDVPDVVAPKTILVGTPEFVCENTTGPWLFTYRATVSAVPSFVTQKTKGLVLTDTPLSFIDELLIYEAAVPADVTTIYVLGAFVLPTKYLSDPTALIFATTNIVRPPLV